MKKRIKQLHLILSFPLGILITIICLTGAVMSMDEYLRPYWSQWETIYRFCMSLHRWLLDPTRSTGRLIVGITTIAFIFILISGVIIWLPKRIKKVESYFKIRWSGGTKRKLLDLHRVLGIYAVGFLLLLSLTGLMWSFQGYREVIFSIVTVERVPDRVAVAYKKDRETGREKRIDFNEASPERKVMRWAYLLHTGRWGGFVGPLLTGTAALIGATLPVTGYWLFFRRVRRRTKREA